jgi:hypothetical protein
MTDPDIIFRQASMQTLRQVADADQRRSAARRSCSSSRIAIEWPALPRP